MAGRQVLVQDDGTGHQAFVEEGPTILLTGGATSTGHFFVGPDDPADTPAFLAILEVGDQWTDTTGGYPYQHKERNAANDDWEFASMVAKDPSGVATMSAVITELGLRVAVGVGGADAELELDASNGKFRVGTVSLIMSSLGDIALGSPATGSLSINADGSMAVGGGGFTTFMFGNLDLSSLPTADPVSAGLAWVDAGVVKVSAG